MWGCCCRDDSFFGIGFAGWWKRRVFSFVIGDSIFAVVKTNGVFAVDAGTLDGHEFGEGMDGAEEASGESSREVV